MFDFIPHVLSSTITTLFPVFASYKALRSSDPAQLTPWLMYWVVLSLVLLTESYIPLITWFPFYAWLRIFPLTYLLLPGASQGATFIYTQHVHPFLATHEAAIEKFISDSHERAKSLGLSYIKGAMEFVRVNILRLEPTPPAVTPPSSTYAQSLLARFSLPTAREGLAAPAGDFYGLLSSALQQATSGTGKSREAQVEDLSASGTLIPPSMKTKEERMSYITAQRERLRVLLQAFDRAAEGAGTTGVDKDDMRKSRSELDFDKITHEDLAAGGSNAGGGDTMGSVIGGAVGSWMWGGKSKGSHSKTKGE